MNNYNPCLSSCDKLTFIHVIKTLDFDKLDVRWWGFCQAYIIVVVVVVVVDCDLTSHSAIFQLYSDGTDVQIPNFDLLPGTNAMGS